MEDQFFPIYDSDGVYILFDEAGREIHLNETEVRKAIGARELGVLHGRGRERKIVLRSPEAGLELCGHKIRRIESSPPFCIEIPVGYHHHTYMHVAQRCQAAYDGRPMPARYSASGKMVGYASWGIDPDCL